MSPRHVFLMIFVPTLVFSLTFAVLILLKPTQTQPPVQDSRPIWDTPVQIKPTIPKPRVEPQSAQWMRVDTDFQNMTCDDFCASKGKTCGTYQCKPDQWCGATGGMMEIETWDSSVGIVCDRTWQGSCDVPIDRYPPVFNFNCCCG